MATVTGTLKLNDKMTPTLKSVMTAINSTLRVMQQMDVASTGAFRGAMRDAALATAAVDDFANSFHEVDSAAGKAQQGMGQLLARVFSLTAAVYGIRQAIAGIGAISGISDSMQQSVSRINLINDGMRSTLEYQNMIFDSADRARSSYLETANAVSSLGTNAADAFSGTDEIIAFSELMNKSFKISGADAQAQAGAMRQLSQALASGVLRGDEFNSIAEQAPEVYNAIAKYMGKSKGEVRELAADGAVTAAIVKSAMFAAAEEIEGKFAMIPPTFADCATQMQNDALRAFRPVLEQIGAIAQSERFARFMQDISSFFLVAADHAMQFLSVVEQGAAFAQDNTDTILICLAAIIGMLIILKAQSITTAISAGAAWVAATWPILLVVAALAGLVAAYQNTDGALQALIAIIGVYITWVGAWIAILWVLNTALTANPIGAIIMAIAILIGAIIAIIAWVMDLWKTNMGFKYGVLAIWDSLMFFFGGVPIFFQGVGNGIADAFSWAKVTVLTILQSMANGAIDIINDLIALLNEIPGVAIDPIHQLTFAASAAAEEEAKKQARAQSLSENKAALTAEKEALKAQRSKDRAVEQAALDAKAASKDKSGAENAAESQPNYSSYGGGELGDIGKVGMNTTLVDTGQWFLMRDHFGTLEFLDIAKLKTNLVLGNASLMTGYDYQTSIDEATANRIKLVQENKKAAKRDVYTVQDRANIDRWGLLQHYEKLNENMNVAQIHARAAQLLKLKNRVTRKLQLDCIGDFRVMPGNGVWVETQLDDMRLNRYMMVHVCSHTIKNQLHTMKLTLEVVEDGS